MTETGHILLAGIEGLVACGMAFTIASTFLIGFRTKGWPDIVAFVSAHGFLFLPVLRLSPKYDDLTDIWWHFYIVPHYILIILGAAVAIIYYYKDGFDENDFDLPFLRVGLPIKSKPKFTANTKTASLGAASGFQVQEENLDLVSVTVIRLAVAVFPNSSGSFVSNLETVLPVSPAQKRKFQQVLAEALNANESVPHILNRLRRFQAADHHLKYSVAVKLFALAKYDGQTDSENIGKIAGVARQLGISETEIARILNIPA